VVVCRPFESALTAVVAKDVPKSRFTKVVLPTPDEPARPMVVPAVSQGVNPSTPSPVTELRATTGSPPAASRAWATFAAESGRSALVRTQRGVTPPWRARVASL